LLLLDATSNRAIASMMLLDALMVSNWPTGP
jgi:hypothetical protein